MAKIKNILASEAINSRGYPTIFGKLILDDGHEVHTSVPSQEPLYNYQSVELKDNDKSRFNGKGVNHAVSHINNLIAPKLRGVSLDKQLEIDNWLIKADGSKNKSTLGVNTLLTISSLVAKAAAIDQKIPLYKYINSIFNKLVETKSTIDKLPAPIFPILIAGKHGQVNLDFKQFQIIPSSSFSYSKAYELGVDLYHLLRHLYKFSFSYNLDVLAALKNTIEKKGLAFGRELFLGINFGASSFYSGGRYLVQDKQQPITSEEYLKFIDASIIGKYFPLIVTDCISNEDWQNWTKLNASISKETYLVADELICSNKERIEKAIKEKACSSVVLRPNQIGTITETMLLIDLVRKNHLSYQIASDLGETNDNLIADFSVGVSAEFVNFGPPVHGENVSKYNRLLEIEREIAKK